MDALLQPFQSLLASSTSTVAAIIALGVLLIKAVNLLNDGLTLHDKHFAVKRLKRLTELRAGVANHPALDDYLAQHIATENFRLASGIATSPAKMAYLLKLAATGRWDRAQLKALAKHVVLSPGSEQPALLVGWSDTVLGMISLTCALGMLLVGASYFTLLASHLTVYSVVVGVLVFLIAWLLSRLIVIDGLAWLTARRAVTYLARRSDL